VTTIEDIRTAINKLSDELDKGFDVEQKKDLLVKVLERMVDKIEDLDTEVNALKRAQEAANQNAFW